MTLAISEEEGEWVAREVRLGTKGVPDGESVVAKLTVGAELSEEDREATRGDGDTVADSAKLAEGAGDWEEECV